ncbi:autotransporter outer membrane beta-barrel domain-containing protein [Kaistia terrae]|uniref:Autotransporter outer membrane beta-barrel domain-containing protein n=1 Tax=Kaistia terrae TaxID=537017 RepID=A0ABW0PTJ1_9HYPH|nr:autotransporter outer membrane beta-barrel domain-containing protein [Kaistia terrae]MCX5577036.1 autotransporter outer membrane beta-barrel domain-containing protein [Kaistia terrae]
MPNTPATPASEHSRGRSSQDAGWRSFLVRGGRMVKYKGIVGSVAPHLASAGLVALGVVAFSGSAALAGTCSTSDNTNFACSGPAGAAGTDAPIVINDSGTTTVTTDPGFGIDANGTAITILGSGTGDISFTDTNQSTINGTVYGIYMSGANAGSMNITTNGVITAGSTGILAPMGGNSTGLTIDVNDVNAGAYGVNIVGNSGTGDISVTAHDIEAASNGINFDNGAQTHDFTVDVNKITSTGANGIYGFSSGNGATNITVHDSITADDNGIWIDVDASAGAGATTIDVGDIDAGNEGINIDTNSNTTDLSITTNNIESGASGIRFVHRGTGDTTVVANDITNTTGNGIWFDTYGSGDVSVTAHDIDSGFIGVWIDTAATTKDFTLDVNKITSGDDGINVVHSGDGSVNITVTDSIVAGDDAIELLLDNNNVKDVNLDVNNAQGGNNGIYVTDVSDAVDPTDPDAVNNDLTIVTRGNIKAGSGWGIYTDTDPGVLTKIDVLAGSTVKADSNAAIYNADGDSIVTIRDASEASNSIVGRIDLGAGVDVLNLHGGFSGITSLYGGKTLGDTLNVYDANSTYDADALGPWDSINLYNTTLKLSTGTDTDVGAASDMSNGIFLHNSVLDVSENPDYDSYGNLSIDTTSTFYSRGDAAGNGVLILGGLHNDGLVSLSTPAGVGVAGDLLTIGGQYSGDGGAILIDTVLGDDTSITDLLRFNGGTAEGTTRVGVNNTGGLGGQTVEGIKIIDVTGASDGAFSLIGDYQIAGQQAVLGGAYGYTLWKNGISNPDDGDWYLRSQLAPTGSNPGGLLYQPGAPVFEAYAGVLLGLNSLSTLQQRVGNRSWSGGAVDTDSKLASEPLSGIEGRGIWGRIEAAHTSINPAVSTTGSDYDFDTLKFQAGVDFSVLENESGKLIGAVTGHYGHASADITSSFGDGSISTDGAGFGGTLTWYGNSGFYVDGQAQVSWYDSDLGSDVLGNLASGNDGTGYALSLETGKRIGLNNDLSLTPQAQLVYSSVDFDAFTQTYGGEDVAAISLLNNDSLRGRFGLSLDQNKSWRGENGLVSRSHVYGIANLYYEFLDGTSVDVSGATLASRDDRFWGGVGLGGSYDWNDDKYSIYGEGSVNTSLQNVADSYDLKGTAGFRVKW